VVRPGLGSAVEPGVVLETDVLGAGVLAAAAGADDGGADAAGAGSAAGVAAVAPPLALGCVVVESSSVAGLSAVTAGSRLSGST
jgi:hypothetical protein